MGIGSVRFRNLSALAFWSASVVLAVGINGGAGETLLAESKKPESQEAANSTQTDEFVAVPGKGTIQFEPADEESRVPKRFRLQEHVFSYRADFERESGPVHLYNVRFPSPVETRFDENNTVYGRYFQPKGKGPFAGIVMLHILGGNFELSETIANFLARGKVATLFIKMPYYGERRPRETRRRMISRDPRETAEGMTQAVLDIRRAAGWLASRKEVDTHRLGVTGISLGGIMSALSAAAEPRFRKVAIYLGGGNLGEILWEKDHPKAEAFRKEWKAKGETRESFLEILRPVDPANYGQLLKDRDVLMVAARKDEIITPRSTRALWKSMDQKPKLVWLNSTHVGAAKYLPVEIGRMLAFFGGTWENNSPKSE